MIRAASSDEAEIDRLADEACERLEHDDFYGDLLDRPVSEIIALVCRDLGLAPDWGRLAEEAWAQDEIRSGVAAAPLATLGWAPARASGGRRSLPRGAPGGVAVTSELTAPTP